VCYGIDAFRGCVLLVATFLSRKGSILRLALRSLSVDEIPLALVITWIIVFVSHHNTLCLRDHLFELFRLKSLSLITNGASTDGR
jgi:hypothetical protein